MDISHTEARQLASAVQDIMLTHFGANASLNKGNIVFHGGTALGAVHGSPRFSEDLDFLLNREAFQAGGKDLPTALNEIMEAGVSKIRDAIIERKDVDIDFSVDATLKTSRKSWEPGHPGTYTIELTSPNRRGKLKTVCEFWPTNPEYLAAYETLPDQQLSEDALAQSHAMINTVEGRLYQELPVATVEAILADKMVALANRDYLKWRDVYDVWFIMERLTPKPEINEEFVERFEHHCSAYDGDGTRSPIAHLEAVAAKIEEADMSAVDQGLRVFFESKEWSDVSSDSAERIKTSAATVCRDLAQELHSLDRENNRELGPDLS